jgi:tRNA pseudouridine55 synthase
MFYIVKKPIGISSNLVSKILKRVLNVLKIGFAGTLDPLATGLMIIGTEWSPRLFPLLDTLSKTYTATIRLDGTTPSYDLEHPVEILKIDQKIIDTLTRESLESVIQKNFIGEIMQSPPLYSAVWIDGQRAYDIARKWGDIGEIKQKKRIVHSFKIISYTWPALICEIQVSHGTYIRSIARDLGHALCTGGYLEKLERTAIGHISLEGREWIQHNDIFYTPLSHEELFPEIPVLELSIEDRKHLRLWSTPIKTKQKDGNYFTIYEDNSYGLLEARGENLFPLKNAV